MRRRTVEFGDKEYRHPMAISTNLIGSRWKMLYQLAVVDVRHCEIGVEKLGIMRTGQCKSIDISTTNLSQQPVANERNSMKMRRSWTTSLPQIPSDPCTVAVQSSAPKPQDGSM